MDAVSGEIIFAKMKIKGGPASLTKIMTLILFVNSCRQGKFPYKIRFPFQKSLADQRFKMFVLVVTQVPVEELIKGITIVSGNDACVAAEYIGGTEGIRKKDERQGQGTGFG